jgi:hypothetical protein
MKFGPKNLAPPPEIFGMCAPVCIWNKIQDWRCGPDWFLLRVFSVIQKIVLVSGDSRLLFVVEILDTIELSEHYHSYKVQKSVEKSFEIFFQEEFAAFLPMHVTSPIGDTGLYVNVKYDTDLMNI